MSYRNTLKIAFFALAILVLLAPVCVQAVVIYVSKSGNDGNTGLSWSTAKLTVTAGLAAAVSGDEVWVAKGKYTERITLKAGVALYGGFAGTETELSQRPAFPRPSPDPNETILDGAAGGSVVTAPSGAQSTTRIDGFTIQNGKAVYGGGIYCPSSPSIVNNTIRDNSATYAGGGIAAVGGSPTISRNSIEWNHSNTLGGGLYCSGSPTVFGNTLTGNAASQSGGGIACEEDSSSVLNNTISENTAVTGGGIFCLFGQQVIGNNFVTGNQAFDVGGGIACRNSYASITNNTVTANTASTGGGGIYFYSGAQTTITNNIVCSNSSGVLNAGTGTPSFSHNCVWGNTAYNYSGMADPTGSNGNISQNPRLSDGLHLEAVSPCLDAGNDNAVQPNWVDIDFQARVVPPHVDIGADEYTPTTQVALPSFAPDGGTYDSPQTVTITCSTPGATIHYTTNGNDPTESDPSISSGGTVSITKDTVLKAKAWKTGMWPSAVKSATYTFKVATPTFNPDGGLYDSVQSVVITCATPGARIHYTTNGNDPTIYDPIVSSGGSVTVDRSLVLKAKAWKDPYAPSAVKSATFTLYVSQPVFNPPGGTFTSAQAVTVTCATSGVTIHYTTNGSDPTESDPIVANGGTITVDHSLTLKARAWKGTIGPSSITSATYVLVVTEPTFEPDGGSYSSPKSVTITCSTPGATIRYTTNGSDPTESDTIIPSGGVIQITRNTVLKAKAWRAGWSPSTIKYAEYIIAGAGRVLYVKPNGSDSSDGLSWNTAKRTISAAISAALKGDEIWVKGDPSQPYTEMVNLKNSVALRGGFVGNETKITQRPSFPRGSPDYNEAILDAQNYSGPVVNIPLDATNAVVDGFTIRKGSIGIACYGNAVEICNNTITNNSNSGYGGGICCASATATITGNIITSNTSQSGGAGIICYQGSQVLTSNTISGNISNGAGGGIFCFGGTPNITSNTIVNNQASNIGGGIACLNSAGAIAGNAIAGNSAASGAGIACSNAAPVIQSNLIIQNTTLGSGGGISCEPSASPKILGNVISQNYASTGGGISCNSNSSPAIVNNTLVSNAASYGAGIACRGTSSPPISNNIVSFGLSAIRVDGTSTPSLRNNCLYNPAGTNYEGIAPGIGDISQDPLFVDRLGGDYHLTEQSPCVNAGWNGEPNLPSSDMDAEPRIMGGIVDIGSDEFQLAPITITSIQNTKMAPDGTWVQMDNAIVSLAFQNVFYIESDDRASGIRVAKLGHNLSTGMRATVNGQVKTNADGERYIDARTAYQNGTGFVNPIGMNNKCLGGEDLGYNPITGAGQKGVKNGTGLNNIGLLVTVYGRVTSVDPGSPMYWFDIDDGSGVGVRVAIPPGVVIEVFEGDFVKVTGASSCQKVGNFLNRVIRPASARDITIYP